MQKETFITVRVVVYCSFFNEKNEIAEFVIEIIPLLLAFFARNVLFVILYFLLYT